MKQDLQDNKKIFDFVYYFENIVKKEKLVPQYDKDTDSLSFVLPKLSDSARISYLDDEIALYINKDKDVEGIFIEYFKSNFVKHHKELKNIATEIDTQKTKTQSLINLKKIQSKNILPKFEEVIKSALLENIQFQKQSCQL